MIIRKLVSTDYDAMLVLYKALDEFHVEVRPDYFAHRDEMYPRDVFEGNIVNPICLELGAFDDAGNMLGTVGATLLNESGMIKALKTVCLDYIYVLPSHRRRGIAAKLFAQVELWARQQGAVRLELHTWDFNAGAIAMYRSMGMTPQRYVFEKKLTEPDPDPQPQYRIIPYEDKYRDDMIYMVLEAKDALGRIPGLNEDLLDIRKNYLDTGDMFWLAVDGSDRVIGCVGFNSIPGTREVRLHRLYVKASQKRRGIGTRLLQTAEGYLRKRGKTVVHVHLGGKGYFESRSFYPKHGYKEYDKDMMKKEL